MASKILAKTAVAGVLLAAFCLPVAASLSGPRQDSADQSSATEPGALGAADYTVRGRSGSSSAKPGISAKPSAKPSTKPSAKPSAKPARATRYPGYYGPVGGPSRRPKPVFLGVGGSW